jgi:hypothetical protein
MSDLSDGIRSRGYWRVQLRPNAFNEKRVSSLAELERAIERAHVELRGWDYPHVPRQIDRHADFIEGTVNFERHQEVWRLYQSAQFVHLFAMTEDWMNDPRAGWSSGPIQPGKLLEVTSTLWTFTEMFLFFARLVEALTLGPEVVVAYRLIGLGGRQLQTLDPRRMPLHEWRKAADDLKEFGQELTLPVSKLIASSSEIAVDQALMLYERFHWEPDRASVIEEQRKLLERRF